MSFKRRNPAVVVEQHEDDTYFENGIDKNENELALQKVRTDTVMHATVNIANTKDQ